MEKLKMHQNSVTLVFVMLIMAEHVECFFLEDTPYRISYAEAKVGGHAIFNCHIDFPQEIEIPYALQWLKDGKVIFSWYDGVFNFDENYVGRVLLLDKYRGHPPHLGRASINLTSIRETDGGWFQCKIYFPNRTPSSMNNGSMYHLAVDGDTLLKIPPINQTVMEGDPMQLQCIVKNTDTMFVTWYKDNVELEKYIDLSRRTSMDHNGSITINPTQMSDLGLYKCKIRSKGGDEQTASAYVNVQYKAKVIYSPREVYFPYGAPGILDCHFRANPPLTNLRWEKDGFLFDPYNVQGVFYKRNGSLYFAKVNDDHAGRYTCTPYNALGTEGSSPTIHVIVQRPPFFRVKPKQIYFTKLGESIQLHCAARDPTNDHYVAPIDWLRKDGRPLPVGRYELDEGNLTIHKVKEEDRGVYQCVASNQAAKICVDTEIMIENVAPMAPFNLTANSSSTAITLRWVPGQLRSTLNYLIWFRQTDAQEWRSTKSEEDTEHTIYNLMPATEYEFMVLSQDKYGDGTFSKTFRYLTKPTSYQEPELFTDQQMMAFSQIGPPRNLTLFINDDGEYILRWDPPDYGMESFRYYILEWWQEPGHILHGQIETSNLTYTIYHLREDVTFMFQVFSLSVNDYRSGSNEITILVPPYNRIRVTVIGTAVGISCIIFAGIAIWYARQNWRKM